jgi:2-polyprenyl-3-methyl-5-hydroxy-6-metoxy-1,4-benzoquinol methylase
MRLASALEALSSRTVARQTPTSDSRLESPPGPMTAAERIKASGRFSLDDIDLVVAAIKAHSVARGTPWDDFRLADCELPNWFCHGLDPFSAEYAAQQQRLWSALAGVDRPYQPEVDEKEDPLQDVDAVRRPAYFVRRDPGALENAAEHIIATGMILKHCGLEPGDRALEYGAGFGQAALTLARLGVVVDTVDISAVFCRYVSEQADFFQVPLSAFEGRFGWNPRGTQLYDLILFYESFHHCADFQNVVQTIKRHLAPRGRVMLIGEPIHRGESPSVPYPWGLRLNAEPVAQIRRFGWYELGFTEDFLVGLFCNAGFRAERIECSASTLGEGYFFEHRPAAIDLCQQWVPEQAGWHAADTQARGRWTKGEARLFVDSTASFNEFAIDATNHHPFGQSVEISYGAERCSVSFKAGERRETVIRTERKAREIVIRTRTYVPAADYDTPTHDSRELGILIHSVAYR